MTATASSAGNTHRALRATAHRLVAEVKETCAYGDEHTVFYYESIVLADTGDKRPHNNGYGVEETPLYTDAEGRIYHVHPAIGFSDATVYKRDDDEAYFRSRSDGRNVRGLDGQPLNEHTPAGPSLADLRESHATTQHVVERY